MFAMFKAFSGLFMLNKRKHYNTCNPKSKRSLDQEEIPKEVFRHLDSFENGSEENDKTTDNQAKQSFSMEKFTFVSPIPEERYNDTVAHLKDHYIDKPLLKYLGLLNVKDSSARLETYSLETLQNHLSMIVVDTDDDKIVAVSLNSIKLPDDKEQKMKFLRNIDDKHMKMYSLIANLNDCVDIFFKFNVDQIFTIEIVSVHTYFRESRLVEELVKRTEKLAKQHNFKVMTTEVSEQAFVKMLCSLGWELVEEIKYEDNTNEDGVEILETQRNSIKVMVKKLQREILCDLT